MPTSTDPASAAAEELLQQADASQRSGDPALAAALYRRVLTLWPQAPAARLAAARLDALGPQAPAAAPLPAVAMPVADDGYLPGELAAACLRVAALVCLIVLSLLAGWLLVDATVGRHAPADGRSLLPGTLALLGAIVLPALLATIAGIGLNVVALRRRLETPHAP